MMMTTLLNLRLKDRLGPVTRVKKKKKSDDLAGGRVFAEGPPCEGVHVALDYRRVVHLHCQQCFHCQAKRGDACIVKPLMTVRVSSASTGNDAFIVKQRRAFMLRSTARVSSASTASDGTPRQVCKTIPK